jgi:hypothetical protein
VNSHFLQPILGCNSHHTQKNSWEISFKFTLFCFVANWEPEGKWNYALCIAACLAIMLKSPFLHNCKFYTITHPKTIPYIKLFQWYGLLPMTRTENKMFWNWICCEAEEISSLVKWPIVKWPIKTCSLWEVSAENSQIHTVIVLPSAWSNNRQMCPLGVSLWRCIPFTHIPLLWR